MLHVIEVYIQPKNIKSNDDVGSNIWLNYKGQQPGLKNDRTNQMSFEAGDNDIVIWRGMSVKNAQTQKNSNGLMEITKVELDDHYSIVMTDIARTRRTTGDFIKNVGGQEPASDYIGCTIGEGRIRRVEEYTIVFSIKDSKTGKMTQYSWDPLISDKTKP